MLQEAFMAVLKMDDSK